MSDIRDAWNRMNDDTKRLVVQLWERYNRSGDSSALDELRNIFRNHGDDGDDIRDRVRRLF